MNLNRSEGANKEDEIILVQGARSAGRPFLFLPHTRPLPSFSSKRLELFSPIRSSQMNPTQPNPTSVCRLGMAI